MWCNIKGVVPSWKGFLVISVTVGVEGDGSGVDRWCLK